MKIDFLGLGVQKAGTSTLHDILKQHPQIYLPVKKEAHFFDFNERYKNGLQWFYKTFFADFAQQKVAGKFTPDYIYIKEAPGRIAETLGKNIKFIVVFRHPVDRAVSQYNMIYRKGLEKLDFYQAISQEQERIKASEISNHNFSYMNRGYYTEQVKRYFEIFPAENFMFLIFENDIVKNIDNTINNIQAFLKVDNEQLNVNIKSNEAYEPYNVELNRLFRKDNLVKRTGKILFPASFRFWLKNVFLFKLNKRSKGKPVLFKLTTEEREKYFNEYFLNDTKQLEKLLNINLNGVWYNE